MAGLANSENRWVTCVCGKRGWHDKKDAKAVMRKMRDRELNVYRCERGEGLTATWHIGHMWEAVKQGRLDRSEMWQGDRSW